MNDKIYAKDIFGVKYVSKINRMEIMEPHYRMR